MSKLARACAVAFIVATSLAGGIAAAQIQSGVSRKSAPYSVALGVPVAKANVSQRSSSGATTGSGNSLGFTSGQPAQRSCVHASILADRGRRQLPSSRGDGSC